MHLFVYLQVYSCTFSKKKKKKKSIYAYAYNYKLCKNKESPSFTKSPLCYLLNLIRILKRKKKKKEESPLCYLLNSTVGICSFTLAWPNIEER